jgi:hypothetical protein
MLIRAVRGAFAAPVQGLRCMSAAPTVGVLDGSLDKNSEAFKVGAARLLTPTSSAGSGFLNPLTPSTSLVPLPSPSGPLWP